MKTSSYSPHYKRIREWLRSQREDHGLSLRDAAAKVQRHHSVIGKWEQNRRRLDIVEYVDYCLAMDIDPREGLEILIESFNVDSERE